MIFICVFSAGMVRVFKRRKFRKRYAKLSYGSFRRKHWQVTRPRLATQIRAPSLCGASAVWGGALKNSQFVVKP